MKVYELWATLEADPGRFALVHGSGSRQATVSMAAAMAAEWCSVGRTLVVDHSDGWRRPEVGLDQCSYLVDLDVLFWPDVNVDPIRLLRSLARRGPLIAEWPGAIEGGRVTYSEPGRPDYCNQPIPDQAIVLRARFTSFPDELPYDVERI